MRTSPTPLVARPAWYDRNPTVKAFNYQANNTAPHGNTKRFTYTVPAGRKAMLEYACVFVNRSAAADSVGRVQADIRIQPSGGSVIVVSLAQILTNNVGDSDRMDVGQSMVLLAGDIIEGWTVDNSTGGTVNYLLAVKLLEFDA